MSATIALAKAVVRLWVECVSILQPFWLRAFFTPTFHWLLRLSSASEKNVGVGWLAAPLVQKERVLHLGLQHLGSRTHQKCIKFWKVLDLVWLAKGCKRLVTLSHSCQFCCRTMPEWASIPSWSQIRNAPGVSGIPSQRTREELLEIADAFAPLCVCMCLASRKETEASTIRFSKSYDILVVCFASF